MEMAGTIAMGLLGTAAEGGARRRSSPRVTGPLGSPARWG